MKKTALVLAMTALAAVACKKDNDADDTTATDTTTVAPAVAPAAPVAPPVADTTAGMTGTTDTMAPGTNQQDTLIKVDSLNKKP